MLWQPRGMRLRHVTPVVLVLLPLAGCSDQQAAAEESAQELAAALESGDITDVVDPQAQEVYAGTVEGLGDLEPTVEVGDVDREDDAATAVLRWSWPLERQSWEYDAEVTLVRDGEQWRPEWDVTAIAPDLGDDEVLVARTLLPERAPILGGDGKPLVRPRPVTRYGLDKARVRPGQVTASARAVARTLDIEVKPYVKLARTAGPRAFVEGLVLRRADAGQVPGSFSDIPGAGAVEDELSLAPTRGFAAPILGRVGPVTAEIVEESEGRYRAGDEAGLSGLQARYDERLAGEPGEAVLAVQPGGGPERALQEVEPTEGEPLRLTLDQRTQRVAESALATLPESAGDSALVAIRPRDGAILAAANGEANGGLNAATYGRYAPGSTFKVVSALALLRAGLSPQSPLTCSESTVVDGKRFENYDGYPAGAYGRIPLARALAESCNTAFVGARTRLGRGDLSEAAAALGVGTDFDVGFPAFFGQVPPPKSRTEAAADMIGQGRVQASPMAMAAVAASVAAGRTVVPSLVDGSEPEPDPAVPLKRQEAGRLKAMMRGVVTNGTASILSGLGKVGGKTGTAEYGEPGPGGRLPTHAWMLATRQDVAVAVFVEKGDSGSGTAGPVLADFLRRVR